MMTVENAASKKRNVFISYAHTDREFVSTLAGELKQEFPATVWIDESEITAGDEFTLVIGAAIERCTHFLAVLSPEAMKSRFVQDEIHLALAKDRKTIPVLLRPCDLPWRLLRWHYADFTGPNKKNRFTELRSAIRKNSNRPLSNPKFYYWVLTPMHAAATGAAVALLILLTILLSPPSRTSATLLDSGSPRIVKLQLRNHGWHPSSVVGRYRLKFDDLPIEDANLALVDPKARTMVLPQWTLDVFLKEPPTRFDFRPRKDGSYPTVAEVDKVIRDQTVTLEVAVEESNDPAPGRQHHVRATCFPVTRIWPFLRSNLPTIPGGQAHAP